MGSPGSGGNNRGAGLRSQKSLGSTDPLSGVSCWFGLTEGPLVGSFAISDFYFYLFYHPLLGLRTAFSLQRTVPGWWIEWENALREG